MAADGLTKALPRQKIEEFVRQLGLKEINTESVNHGLFNEAGHAAGGAANDEPSGKQVDELEELNRAPISLESIRNPNTLSRAIAPASTEDAEGI